MPSVNLEVLTQVSRAESDRFISGSSGDVAAACAKLHEHLVWRAANFPRAPSGRPTWAHWHGRAIDGTRIVHANPAKIDMELGSNEDYVLDLCELLEKELDRESDETMTVLLDTRGGVGWPNPPITQVVPFAKQAISVLTANYPGRLERIVIYPVPLALSSVWEMLKLVLGEDYQKKVVILRGPGRPGPDAADEELSTPRELGKYVTFEAFRDDIANRHLDLKLCHSGTDCGVMDSGLTASSG